MPVTARVDQNDKFYLQKGKKMNSYRNDFGVTALSLQVGECDTERRVVWYQIQSRKGARVRYAKSCDYDRDGGFNCENSTIVEARTEKPYGNDTYLSCKARLCNLEKGTEYIYCVGDGEEFDVDEYRFYIPKDPENSVCFGIMSDVHFNVYQRKASDVYYHSRLVDWSNTVKCIREYGKELPAFVMSIGDNASSAQMPAHCFAHPEMKTPQGVAHYLEKENEEFFHVPLMKSTAFASVLGNHDAQGYEEPNPYASVTAYHFDMPNDDGVTGHFESNSHGNFYFMCGQALIIGMNIIVAQHGNYKDNVKTHRDFILRAIEAHPEAKWRFIFNHVPAYAYIGSADINAKGAETEPSKMRKVFLELLDGIDIDVVFTGHQHAFSRSYNILNGEPIDRDKIESTRDENGCTSDKAKDVRGIMHYNVPAPTNFSFFSSISENCHDFYANYGVAECGLKSGKEAGLAAADDYRGFLYNQPMYVHAELESTQDSYKLTLKCIGRNDCIAYDTYVLEKSK
jgi:hypothetical protein